MKRFFTRTLVMMLAFATLSASSFAAVVVTPVSGDPTPAAVKSAVSDFKNLSKKEKAARISNVKKAIKNYRAAKAAGSEPSTNTLLLVILAILLPPLAVYLHEGEINGKFWLDLILSLIFFVPGVIYALIVVLGDSAK